MGSPQQRIRLLLAILLLATGAVFLLDLIVPLGIAVPMLYVPALVGASRLLSWRATLGLFGLCVALTLVVPLFPAERVHESITWLDHANRLGFVIIGGAVVWLALAARRAEARQRESHETLCFTLRNSPVTVFTQDDQLRYTRFFNPQLGVGEQQVLGKTDAELHGAEIGQGLAALKRHVLQTGRGARAEIPVTIDGRMVYYDATIEPTFDDDGRPGITCVLFDITQRQLAENAIRRSEEQLRQFVEQVPAAVAMFDRDMRYIAHSRRWRTDLYPRETNLIGRSPYEVFPTMPERWKEAHRRALAGEVVRTEYDEWIGTDGQQRVAVWELRPWYDREDRVAGILIFVDLITERSRIEQRLRDSEALYRTLVESLPVSVWRKDLHGRYTFANRMYLDALGKTSGQMIGVTDEDLFPIHLATKYREDDRRVAETGSVLDTNEDYVHRDGSLRHIRTIKTPLLDAEQRIVGTQGMFWDVTDKRRAEEALQRRERDFRALAENLPDVVARYDRDLHRVYVNRAIERITGLPVEAFLNSNAELVPPELLQQFHQAQHEVLTQGGPRSLEFTFSGVGGPRHYECRLLPEFASDGSVESILSISRDVTDRMRAQEQMEIHLAQLAHVSRLSTIGELVSEIAHEINQPLHAIVNFAQASINTLENMPVDRRANLFGWLKQISEQANRAAEIIRRARKFVRKTPANRSTANLNELVRDCLKLVNFDLRVHHVKLRCELADQLPPVLADVIQMQQVLVNLLRNAVDAMSDNPADNRRLVLRTSKVGDDLQVSVCDNGRGIAEIDTNRLFEPFFTTKPEGMGMGLAVSQSIVQAHSGRLWAEPNAERGVTFYFTLPVRTQEPIHDYIHA